MSEMDISEYGSEFYRYNITCNSFIMAIDNNFENLDNYGVNNNNSSDIEYGMQYNNTVANFLDREYNDLDFNNCITLIL